MLLSQVTHFFFLNSTDAGPRFT